MVRLVSETTTRSYYEEGKMTVTHIEHYRYATDEQRTAHKKEMEAIGYKHSGQVCDNIGTVVEPVHVFAGYFMRNSVVDIAREIIPENNSNENNINNEGGQTEC